MITNQANIEQRGNSVKVIISTIGQRGPQGPPGEATRFFDSVQAAVNADPVVHDDQIFETPEGIWRRDSSLPEGAEFLRPFPKELESFAGEFRLEQGSVLNNGDLIDNPNRVRTTLFRGGADIEVNPGYSIFRAHSFNKDGEFIENLTNQDTDRQKFSFKNKHWSRVVFSKVGGQESLNPTDDIIKNWSTEAEAESGAGTFALNPDAIEVNLSESKLTISSSLYVLADGLYAVVSPTEIDFSGVSSTSKFIIYDKENNTISVEGVNVGEYLGGDKSLLGFIRSGYVYINGRDTDSGSNPDNGSDPDSENLSETYIVGGGGFKVDTINKTISVDAATYVLIDGLYTPLSESVLDYSGTSGVATFFLLDIETKELTATGILANSSVPEGKSLLGYIRRDSIYFNGSYTLNGVLMPNAGGDSEKTVKNIVSTSYSFDGLVDPLPSTFQEVYDHYDSLASMHPQYITKEVLGKSRTSVTIDVMSIDTLPITMKVDSVEYLSVGDVVDIDGNNFEIIDVWENNTGFSSIGDHIMIKAINPVGIPQSGEIRDAGDNILTTYTDRRFSRYTVYVNSLSNPLFVSEGDFDNSIIEGVFESGGDNVPENGNLLDSEGNIITTYSSLSVTEGHNINCYTFDFSPERDESDVKNRLFVLGGVHGYEKKAMLGHMTFFSELCNNWRESEELTLLRNIRYTVIPIANPWGANRGVNYNAHGVDLNRNFEGDYLTTNPMYYRWSGPQPLSEPEAVVIKDKIEEVADSTFAFIDCHNDGSVLGGLMVTPMSDKDVANAISRNINNNMNRGYPEIPTYLYGWSNNDDDLWSLNPNPEIGDSVLTNSRSLDNQLEIQGVEEGGITVGGIVYTRNSSIDENRTNLYRVINKSPEGSAAIQANLLGVEDAFLMEFGRGYLNNNDLHKLQIETTTNVIASLAKTLL